MVQIIINNRIFVGKSINISNSKVTIDGIEQKIENEKAININIVGNIENLVLDYGNTNIKGNVGNTNIKGNVGKIYFKY